MPLRLILGLNWLGESSLWGGESSLGGGESSPFSEPCWCLGGFWVPLGTKMAPSPLPDTSWDGFCRILGANLVDCWSQFGGFLASTWNILLT